MGRAGIYRFFGHAPVIATALKLVRWPLLLAILLAVIAAVYRYGPNARHTWRQCLPGAAPAVLLWVGAAALFRAYLFGRAGAPTRLSSTDPHVVLIGRAVGVDWHRRLDVLVRPGRADRRVTQRRTGPELAQHPEAARSGRTSQPRDPTEQTSGV